MMNIGINVIIHISVNALFNMNANIMAEFKGTKTTPNLTAYLPFLNSQKQKILESLSWERPLLSAIPVASHPSWYSRYFIFKTIKIFLFQLYTLNFPPALEFILHCALHFYQRGKIKVSKAWKCKKQGISLILNQICCTYKLSCIPLR